MALLYWTVLLQILSNIIIIISIGKLIESTGYGTANRLQNDCYLVYNPLHQVKLALQRCVQQQSQRVELDSQAVARPL